MTGSAPRWIDASYQAAAEATVRAGPRWWARLYGEPAYDDQGLPRSAGPADIYGMAPPERQAFVIEAILAQLDARLLPVVFKNQPESERQLTDDILLFL